MEQILSIVVRNQPGVLMRVAGMFSRRGFNIDSSGCRHDAKPRVLTYDSDDGG